MDRLPTEGKADGASTLLVDHSGSAQEGDAVPSFRIRQLRGRDVRAVVTLERNAFPLDPWTTSTARGWLARSRVGTHPRYAAFTARLIRLVRIGQIISAIRLLQLVAFSRPAAFSCVVAEEDSAIIGYAYLDTAPPGKGVIQMIAVEDGRQGRGVGSALLADLMKTASNCGCSGVTLHVRADNPRARRLYRNVGFTEIGALPSYYQPSRTDAIMMGVDFPSPRTTHSPAWSPE
jgi:ribosomal protein S18 acetylase RimI-like enzyme